MSRYRMSFLIGAFEGRLHFDYQLQHRLSHLGIVRGAGSQNLAACSASPQSEGKCMVRHSTSARYLHRVISCSLVHDTWHQTPVARAAARWLLVPFPTWEPSMAGAGGAPIPSKSRLAPSSEARAGGIPLTRSILGGTRSSWGMSNFALLVHEAFAAERNVLASSWFLLENQSRGNIHGTCPPHHHHQRAHPVHARGAQDA